MQGTGPRDPRVLDKVQQRPTRNITAAVHCGMRIAWKDKAVTGYIFDNAAERETEQRFGSLAALYDPRTIHFLEATGVGSGWRCLEIGAGGESIATWLADRVGDTGHVTATDIDPRFLATLSALGRQRGQE